MIILNLKTIRVKTRILLLNRNKMIEIQNIRITEIRIN